MVSSPYPCVRAECEKPFFRCPQTVHKRTHTHKPHIRTQRKPELLPHRDTRWRLERNTNEVLWPGQGEPTVRLGGCGWILVCKMSRRGRRSNSIINTPTRRWTCTAYPHQHRQPNRSPFGIVSHTIRKWLDALRAASAARGTTSFSADVDVGRRRRRRWLV